jgi:hypothetical protein
MTKRDRIVPAAAMKARAWSARLRRWIAEVRRTKARAEAELFGGRYRLASKSATIFRSCIDPSQLDQRRTTMSKGEPPLASCPTTLTFLIGQNSHGQWVVQDRRGLCGGLFVDRAEALKFAMFETGHRPQAVIMVPGGLELDLSAKPLAADRALSAREPVRARAA